MNRTIPPARISDFGTKLLAGTGRLSGAYPLIAGGGAPVGPVGSDRSGLQRELWVLLEFCAAMAWNG